MPTCLRTYKQRDKVSTEGEIDKGVRRQSLGALSRNNIRMDLRGRVGRCGLDSSGSGYGSAAGPCEYSKESWSFIKGGEFLD
jgi:hypothetical protein